MEEGKRIGMLILAIVAIIAIIGLVLLFRGGTTGAGFVGPIGVPPSLPDSCIVQCMSQCTPNVHQEFGACASNCHTQCGLGNSLTGAVTFETCEHLFRALANAVSGSPQTGAGGLGSEQCQNIWGRTGCGEFFNPPIGC
jgi:hypothetical protein